MKHVERVEVFNGGLAPRYKTLLMCYYEIGSQCEASSNRLCGLCVSASLRDPRCGVPCRAAAIKLSRHSRSLGLPTSPWVVGALKGRLRVLSASASLR